MAFPVGWSRRCKLTIDHTKVPSDQSNFPVLLTIVNVPSEMLDADGSFPANSDGSDIRCSSDKNGTTQLPVEVYYVLTNNNPALAKVEVWVKITSVSSSVDTDFYIWYHNGSATLPARNSTYGSDNVWDASFEFVSHEGATIDDSTSHALTGTNHSTTEDTATTLIGVSSRKFVRGSSQYIDYGNNVNINGDVDLTIEAISNFSTMVDGDYYFIFGRGDLQYYLQKSASNATGVQFTINDGVSWKNAQDGITLSTGTWYYHAGRRTASTNLIELFRNASVDATTDTPTTIQSTTENLLAGKNDSAGNRYMNGYIEEVRISSTNRSANWITTTYNTINSPSTFITEGTPEDAGQIFGFSPFFAAQGTRGGPLIMGVQ